MHIYESKIWKLVPQFFICPGKKNSSSIQSSLGFTLRKTFSWLHLAKNMAWAARLYFSSPGGSKCFSTSTQSSSIALKASPKSNKQNLTDLMRGEQETPLKSSLHSSNMFGWLANVGILINSLCYWAAGLSIPCCTPAVTESLSCFSFWFWFGKLSVWFWLRWLSPRSISLPTRAELSSAI